MPQRRSRTPFSRSPLFRRLESAARRNLGDADAMRLLQEANRYARRGGSSMVEALKTIKRRLFDSLIRRLGPLGSLFKALLRPSGRRLADEDKELTAAANLLNAVGPRASLSTRDTEDAKIELQKLLAKQGFTTVAPPPPPPTLPAGRPSRKQDGEFEEWKGPLPPRVGSNWVEVKVGNSVRRFKQNDPLLTGAMIDVTSSNVHSIGYRFNHADPAKGALLVRFLQDGPNGKKSGPGALYSYGPIHPDLFLKFRLAASAGKFVWDKLRVRGSATAHQVPYELIGVTNGYVPRKATRLGPNDFYLPRSMKARSVKTGEVRTLESALPAQRVRTGQPNRGTPSRGRPNRGR